MKKLSIAILAVAAVSAPAQIKDFWQNTLSDPDFATRTMGVAVTPNGNTLALSYMENGDLRISRYDGAGGRMWSQRYSDAANPDRYTTIRTDSEGNAIMIHRGGGINRMTKFDDQGQFKWTVALTDFAQVVDMKVDGQDNVVLLGAALSGGASAGPIVAKYSRAGVRVADYKEVSNQFYATSLSVAGNGQVYYTSRKYTGEMNQATALSPNLTYRYQTGWFSGRSPLSAADRNGRLSVVEAVGGTGYVLMFKSDGKFTTLIYSLAGSVSIMRPEFDANGRLVIATQVKTSPTTEALAVDYLTATDPASYISRAQLGDASVYNLGGIDVDAFGQTYLYGQKKISGVTYGVVAAFDEQHWTPVWSKVDPNGPLGYNWDSHAAVGRWGQVALATTQGTMRLFEGVTGVRQLGLRNLTINGQSFTGGRTITGTVNFYGSAGAYRSVAMTSNTNYAQIAEYATVAPGASQTTMSIDIQPTSVRRAVSIEGHFDGTMRKAVFYIEPPVAASLTLFPTSTKGGKVVNATGRLNGIAPTAGISASLSSDKAAAPVPTTLTFGSGQISKGFTIQTAPVSITQTATLTMTTGSVAKTAALTITP